jgi:hypothetical protein
MEARCSSETSVDFQRTTRRYVAQDIILHNHRCENLKSYIKLYWFGIESSRDIYFSVIGITVSYNVR